MLPGDNGRDSRWVRRDLLGSDPAYGVVDGHGFSWTEKGVAGPLHALELQVVRLWQLDRLFTPNLDGARITDGRTPTSERRGVVAPP
jgi:hypothetical protein